MSIVSVHGPNTWGSKGIVEQGPATAVVDPANGLKWDFRLDGPTTRVNADFAWTFPTDGTPTPQNVSDPTVVTYATAGTKTAQLVVTGAGAGNNPYPPAGTYPIVITAVAGAGPQTGLMSAPGGDEPPPEDDEDIFDPAEYTIPEIEAYAEENPEQIQDLIDAEEAGKNRSTLIAWLEARLTEQ